MPLIASGYRGGPIKVLAGIQDSSLGSGGKLVNDNFKTIYNLINPTNTSDGLRSVATVYDDGVYKITTFGLPSTYSLMNNQPYVAVYTKGGSVTWEPYTGSGAVAGTTNPSELYNPANNSATVYYLQSGSYWMESISSMDSFQKTYKKLVQGSTATVNVPPFGFFMVTGTILFLEPAYNDSSPSAALLTHVFEVGNNGTLIPDASYEECRCGGNWTSCSIGPSISNLQLSFTYSNAETVLMDLTVVGGGSAKVGASGIYFTS